jgi:hypothetical protein
MAGINFMGFPVKKIVKVNQERFCPSGYREPVEVRPVPLQSMAHLGDLSDKIVYVFPKKDDVKNGIFYIFIADRE